MRSLIYHLGVVDLLEEEDLKKEHAALDNHDNMIIGLFGRLANLPTQEERSKPDPGRSLHRRLLHLEGSLCKVSEVVFAFADKVEVD